METFRLTREKLLTDLYQAWYDARLGKRNKPYQQRFESEASQNLDALCDELWNRRYTPGQSSCFIITDPKCREVFAASFRDRIVHHLYFNYVHEMLERTFIADSYSCIKGRGTHYGINRLEHHIRQCSDNYGSPCYVMKMDIRGYFMHIDRERLLKLTIDSILKMSGHKVGKYSTVRWRNLVDIDFVCWLTEVIVLSNPIINCRIVGDKSDWLQLPHDKSLFYSPSGCGLPIGNLTSQLFSNVYLNALDQFVKRELHVRHYGRYVDDFYIVGGNRHQLCCLIAPIRNFLNEKLGLTLHNGKLRITDVRYGVDFLGVEIRPWHRLLSKKTIGRIKRKIDVLYYYALDRIKLDTDKRVMAEHVRNSLNSFCGIMSHCSSYRMRCRLLSETYPAFHRLGYFSRYISRFCLYGDIFVT